MMPWAVNLLVIAAVAFIVWWFWLSTPRAQAVAGDAPVEVIVDGGVYTPARIEVAAGKPLTLRFLRRDPSPCAEQVVFDRLKISEELPVDRPKDVHLPALATGEYEFTCQMGMYRGALVAR